MDFQLNTKIIHENHDAERWIVEVTARHTADDGATGKQQFICYVDPDRIEVTPCGTLRSAFEWKDWIFDNLMGDVQAACCIAVLAVYGSEDAWGMVVQEIFPEPAERPKVVKELEKQQPEPNQDDTLDEGQLKSFDDPATLTS